MKKERYICIRKLEQVVDGKLITAFPGSYWLMEQRTYWTGKNILVNEHKEEWVLDLSDYLLELCFKPTARRL